MVAGFADWKRQLHERSHQEGACRIWDGAINDDGYGVFSFVDESGLRRSVGAHKAAFLASGKALLPGQVVRHVGCHRTLCIEPGHLAAGTQLENIRDREHAGTRFRRGGATKASHADRAKRIAAMKAGITAREFSKEFGVGMNAAFQWLRRWRARSVSPGNN